MGIHFSFCRIFLCVLLVLLFCGGYSARKIPHSESKEEADQEFHESSKEIHLVIKNGNNMGHNMADMDPTFKVFFTIKDLKIGKIIPIYFPNKNPSTSPHLLSREETNSIPFSSKQLPYLLEFFTFSKDSPQAKGMEYTLRQCESEPIEGETKLCATSLESMLDFARVTFGLQSQIKVLTTNYLIKPVAELQNYTILENPREVLASKIIGCHIMPYPFAVYYCHSREGDTKLFEILLGGENGERVEAAAICHMDTSQWDRDHVSFRLLKIEPGSPVCHFLPADNIVWVPLSAKSD